MCLDGFSVMAMLSSHSGPELLGDGSEMQNRCDSADMWLVYLDSFTYAHRRDLMIRYFLMIEALHYDGTMPCV